MKNTKTQKIVGIGLFTAIIVALQLLAASIKFGPFSITLVLAPIVIGAALYTASVQEHGSALHLASVFLSAVMRQHL